VALSHPGLPLWRSHPSQRPASAIPSQDLEKVLQRDCGFEGRTGDEEGLVEEVQRQAWKAHRRTLSHDEAPVLVLRAELGASLPIATARTTTARKRKGEA
jgi:hypothetical protein